MQWARLVVDAVQGLAWPVTVVVIVLVFRRQIRERVGSLREAEFPGGLKFRLDALQRNVEATPDISQRLGAQESLTAPATGRSSVGRVVLATTRLEMEREIFRFAQLISSIDQMRVDRVEPLVHLLVERELLSHSVASALLDHLRIADELLHLADPDDEELTAALRLGETLLAYLRHAHSVERLITDMDGHGVWHMHGDGENPRFFWAALASEASLFHYDYAVLVEAVEKFHRRSPRWPITLPSLRDFVEILEFRQRELSRVLDARSQGSDPEDPRWDYWRWPDQWGHIPWSGPVSGHSDWSREEDLFVTTRALNAYREKLSAAKTTSPA